MRDHSAVIKAIASDAKTGARGAVLLSGAAGTGGTMAAEMLAAELGTTVYRVDLRAVVSQYGGETEKNLEKVVNRAEELHALLFFDEADALFGKRTDVKDAHDRYANADVNYLLTRLESYDGLALLATNTGTAIDPAVSRRLRRVIDYPPR